MTSLRKCVRHFMSAVMFGVSSLLPVTSYASTSIFGPYYMGNNYDPGGCFGQWFNRGIGVGYKAVNVQLSGYDMQYTSDHHIKRSSMSITSVSYNSSTGNVAFYVSGCFYDNDASDAFYWRGYYTIVGDKW